MKSDPFRNRYGERKIAKRIPIRLFLRPVKRHVGRGRVECHLGPEGRVRRVALVRPEGDEAATTAHRAGEEDC